MVPRSRFPLTQPFSRRLKAPARADDFAPTAAPEPTQPAPAQSEWSRPDPGVALLLHGEFLPTQPVVSRLRRPDPAWPIVSEIKAKAPPTTARVPVATPITGLEQRRPMPGRLGGPALAAGARLAPAGAHHNSGRSLWVWALLLLVGSRLALLMLLEVEQSSDALWYYDRAREMLATGRYAEEGVSTAYWPVGYPAFLAGVMAVFGTEAVVGQITQLVVALITLLLLHRLCLKWTGDAKVAGVAALMLAAYPNPTGYVLVLFSEPLYGAMLLALLLLAHGARGWRLVLLGVLLGLATLVKPQTLLLAPPLVMLGQLAGRWPKATVQVSVRGSSAGGPGLYPALWRALPGTLLALGVMAATIAPWTWRNLQVMGAPVLVSTNGGMSLLIANNNSMHVGQKTNYNDSDPVFKEMAHSTADQVASDRRARALAWKWIGDNPGRFLALAPWKVWRLWAPDGEVEWWYQHGYAGYEEHKAVFRTLRLGNQAYYVALWALALLAMWRLARAGRWREPQHLMSLWVLGYFSALHTVFAGIPRYHLPLMPLVICYSAFGLVQLWGRKRVAGTRQQWALTRWVKRPRRQARQ